MNSKEVGILLNKANSELMKIQKESSDRMEELKEAAIKTHASEGWPEKTRAANEEVINLQEQFNQIKYEEQRNEYSNIIGRRVWKEEQKYQNGPRAFRIKTTTVRVTGVIELWTTESLRRKSWGLPPIGSVVVRKILKSGKPGHDFETLPTGFEVISTDDGEEIRNTYTISDHSVEPDRSKGYPIYPKIQKTDTLWHFEE